MLYLHSLGHFHPENIISNKFLEDLDIGTTNEWIMERVGIQNRRTVLPLDYIRQTKNANKLESFAVRQYTNAQMGARAARMAIQRAGITAEDIGLLVAGTSTPDRRVCDFFLQSTQHSTCAGPGGRPPGSHGIR